jgi:hypothetical protein
MQHRINARSPQKRRHNQAMLDTDTKADNNPRTARSHLSPLFPPGQITRVGDGVKQQRAGVEKLNKNQSTHTVGDCCQEDEDDHRRTDAQREAAAASPGRRHARTGHCP